MAQFGAAGYVVESLTRNRFLSRKGRYVKHSDRSKTQGAQRAWVHTEEFVLNGGPWAGTAARVFPAYYDHVANFTVITGEPVDFRVFCRVFQAAKDVHSSK